MAKRFTDRLSFSTDSELLAGLDEWRRRRPDLPSRSEAARLIIKAATADLLAPLPPELQPSKKRTR